MYSYIQQTVQYTEYINKSFGEFVRNVFNVRRFNKTKVESVKLEKTFNFEIRI